MKVSIGKYPNKGKQKISVRIDPHDTWSMDHTLAHIIVPMLKQLKETKQGIPDECWPDHPDVFTSEYYDEPEVDGPLHKAAQASEDAAVKRWDDILDKMIWSFTQINEDWDEQFHSGEIDMQWKPLGSGCSEMFYGPNHTHKYDMEGAKAHRARIQEGIDLFAKHYFDLWD